MVDGLSRNQVSGFQRIQLFAAFGYQRKLVLNFAFGYQRKPVLISAFGCCLKKWVSPRQISPAFGLQTSVLSDSFGRQRKPVVNGH